MEEEIKKTHFSNRRLLRSSRFRLEGIFAYKENLPLTANKIKRSVNMINKFELKPNKKTRKTKRYAKRRFTKSTHFLIREDSSGLNSPASVPSDYKYDSNNDSSDTFSAVLELLPFSLSDNEETEINKKDIFGGNEFKKKISYKNKHLSEEDQIAKDLTKLKLFN